MHTDTARLRFRHIDLDKERLVECAIELGIGFD